jgi:hypothetical protein
MVEVVHIEDRIGPRGGRYWILKLACGHLKAVRQPRFDVASFVPVFVKGNKKSERRARSKSSLDHYLAPKRVKCLLGCTGGKAP